MRLLHRTDDADAILESGFRDGSSTYMTGRTWSGVWLSGRPLDINEGADGRDLLIVEIPESTLSEFEWVEEFKPYREFLVPAAVVNRYDVRRATDEDLGF